MAGSEAAQSDITRRDALRGEANIDPGAGDSGIEIGFAKKIAKRSKQDASESEAKKHIVGEQR